MQINKCKLIEMFDRIIVGAGQTGITAAYHLAKHCGALLSRSAKFYVANCMIAVLAKLCY